MAKTLSRTTASPVFYRFFSTSTSRSVSPYPLPSNLISRRSSPSLFHLVGLPRFTTIRTQMDSTGGSYSPLKSGSNISDGPPTENEMAPLFPDGRDYKHWKVSMNQRLRFFTRENAKKQQIIDFYVKILAKIVGSKEEAKRKIYKVSCQNWYGFGCEIDEVTSEKLEKLPEVMMVTPDSYFDPEYKDYGLERFVNGVVVLRSPEREWRIRQLQIKHRKRSEDLVCAWFGGNESLEKKTTLHDQYEKKEG